MEFKLNADGIKIALQINGYEKVKDVDNPIFCDCSYSFVSDSWLNYSKENDPILACDEIDYLVSKLNSLLNDEITNDEEIEFWEPDFTFKLIGKKDLRKDKKYIYIAKGFEIEDICLYWNVHFWNKEEGALSGNMLSICLFREDIEKLLSFLQSIQKIN